MRSANVFRRGASMQSPRQQLASVDDKFKPGPTPIEREPFEDVIKPQYREQLMQMMKLMDQYAQQGDANTKKAVALWQAQVAQGTFSDKVKFEFCRRFYYWLLGRGTEDDHDRTLWGRGNAAVYNPEVRAYIESFSSKRLRYAQQLALLANRVPETLTGYYLYFKYIVGGALKRVQSGHESYWDMSDEDYLSDFEMFHNEFDANRDFIAKPFSQAPGGRVGEEPYPQTQEQKAKYAVKSFSSRPGGDPQITQAARNQFTMQSADRSQNQNDMEEAETATDIPAMTAVSGGTHAQLAPIPPPQQAPAPPAQVKVARSLVPPKTPAPAPPSKVAPAPVPPEDVKRKIETAESLAQHHLKQAAALPKDSAQREEHLKFAETQLRLEESYIKDADRRGNIAVRPDMQWALEEHRAPDLSVSPIAAKSTETASLDNSADNSDDSAVTFQHKLADAHVKKAERLEAEAQVVSPDAKGAVLAKAAEHHETAAQIELATPQKDDKGKDEATVIVDSPSPETVKAATLENAARLRAQAKKIAEAGADPLISHAQREKVLKEVEALSQKALELQLQAEPIEKTDTPTEPVTRDYERIVRQLKDANEELRKARERGAPDEQIDAWSLAIYKLEAARLQLTK